LAVTLQNIVWTQHVWLTIVIFASLNYLQITMTLYGKFTFDGIPYSDLTDVKQRNEIEKVADSLSKGYIQYLLTESNLTINLTSKIEKEDK